MEPGGSSSPGPPDNNRAAVSFCFGEAAVQLHLTEREVEGLTLDAMADIWKVRSFPLRPKKTRRSLQSYL